MVVDDKVVGMRMRDSILVDDRVVGMRVRD